MQKRKTKKNESFKTEIARNQSEYISKLKAKQKVERMIKLGISVAMAIIIGGTLIVTVDAVLGKFSIHNL